MSGTGSFIENVNNIAAKLPIIESANSIFDNGVLPILEEIALLDLDLAIQDLKKGTFLGNRKIDIDLSLNKQGISESMAILDALTVWNDTATTVYYSSATVTFVDGHVIEVPFTNDDLSPLDISSHGSLVTQLLKDVPFTTYLINTGIFDDVGGATGALFRLYDIVGASSNVEKIQLHAASGNYIVQAPIYYWGKTTSAFQTLSMRASDIIKLGNEIDSIIALGNKIGEMLVLQTNIPELVTSPNSLYANIAKLQVIYDEIVAITTVYDDIKVGGTNYINAASADLQLGGTSKLAIVAADLQLGSGSVIVTVKNSIANVNITALAIANVNTTAASIANVNHVGGSIANVNTVGGSIANVNAVAANEININAVNANKTNIDTAAANITAIQNASANAATAAEQAAIATSKAATSESAANVAVAKANEIKAITVATVSTGIAGSAAAVSYNPADGKFYFTIPQGNKGDKGDSFSVNSIGLLASRPLYDARIGGFSFLALDEAKIYFKLSDTSGDWSLGSPFGKGDKGDIGFTGYGWLHGAGVPDNAIGRDNEFYLDMASGNVYLKALGVWVYEMSILSILDDATVSAIKTWSSTKISTELAAKSNIADIQDILTSTDTAKPLSAKQGKVLKDLIDNLVTLLGSNDITLDTLQEIVSFIKLNKTTLDSLAVANIAGLVTALAEKADLASTYTKTETDTADNLRLLKSGGSMSGAINEAKATVASHATTAQIWTALGNTIDWTGTATTTAFPSAPQAGAERTLICAGACSFTAGANLLINGVASGATVTCAVGDQVTVTALSTTQFRLNIIKVAGAQDKLISGTNIATIDGSTLLAGGNIALPTSTANADSFFKTYSINIAGMKRYFASKIISETASEVKLLVAFYSQTNQLLVTIYTANASGSSYTTPVYSGATTITIGGETDVVIGLATNNRAILSYVQSANIKVIACDYTNQAAITFGTEVTTAENTSIVNSITPSGATGLVFLLAKSYSGATVGYLQGVSIASTGLVLTIGAAVNLASADTTHINVMKNETANNVFDIFWSNGGGQLVATQASMTDAIVITKSEDTPLNNGTVYDVTNYPKHKAGTGVYYIPLNGGGNALIFSYMIKVTFAQTGTATAPTLLVRSIAITTIATVGNLVMVYSPTLNKFCIHQISTVVPTANLGWGVYDIATDVYTTVGVVTVASRTAINLESRQNRYFNIADISNATICLPSWSSNASYISNTTNITYDAVTFVPTYKHNMAYMDETGNLQSYSSFTGFSFIKSLKNQYQFVNIESVSDSSVSSDAESIVQRIFGKVFLIAQSSGDTFMFDNGTFSNVKNLKLSTGTGSAMKPIHEISAYSAIQPPVSNATPILVRRLV